MASSDPAQSAICLTVPGDALATPIAVPLALAAASSSASALASSAVDVPLSSRTWAIE
nr:hypothetical protein [Methyloceanibacter superfactus]